MNLSRKLVIVIVALMLAAAGAWWAVKGRAPARLEVVEVAVGEGKETPIALAAGADGTAWFTLDSVDAIGILRDGKVTRMPRGGSSVEPLGIGVDRAGTLWATDPTGIAVRSFGPNGEAGAVPLGTPIARLGRLAVAGDGAVWFAESTAYSFSRIAKGVLTRHVFTSVGGAPYGVAVAPDGTVWGTLQNGNQIVQIAQDGKITEIDIPTRGSSPSDVTVDAKGAVWFVEFRGNKIGRYSQGRFDEYPLPQGIAAPSGIAATPDGSVWFGILRGAALGRVRDGQLTVHPLPRPNARPYSVVADPAGNLWYTDLGGYIGRVPAASLPR